MQDPREEPVVTNTRQVQAGPAGPTVPFRVGETIPLRGVNFQVAEARDGYLILRAVGLTGKAQKRLKAARNRPMRVL